MNYSGIEYDSLKNGEGVNVTLFVSGCSHRCKFCQNKQTWDENAGKEFTEETLNILRTEIAKDYMSGICFSGGDPLYPKNYEEILKISRLLRDEFPNKTQWLYTGYSYEYVKKKYKEILDTIDVIVTEKYNETLGLRKWAGSSNQKVIRVKDDSEII